MRETDLDVADAFFEQSWVEYITTLKKGKYWLKGKSDADTASSICTYNVIKLPVYYLINLIQS